MAGPRSARTVTAAPAARAHAPRASATVIINGRPPPAPVFPGHRRESRRAAAANSQACSSTIRRAERAPDPRLLVPSPHFGASLQMLKLEIGGGGFLPTDGSGNPSRRNPAKGQLGLAGLVMSFWLGPPGPGPQFPPRDQAVRPAVDRAPGPGSANPLHGGLWSRADVGYGLVGWLRCARQERPGYPATFGGWERGISGGTPRSSGGLVRNPAARR